MIKRILLSGSMLAAISAPAWADFQFTVGSGLTAVSFDATHSGTSRCAAANTQCYAFVPMDTAGTALGTSGNPFNVVFPSAQAVSGTVTANLGTIAGVSTAAKQPALGTAGSASTDVISVQGIASMTPFLANPGTASLWGIGTSTQNSASVANGHLVLGQFNTSPTTITTGNMSPLQMDNAGNLLVNIKAGAGSGGTALADAGSFVQTTTNMTPMGCLFTTSVTNLTTGQAGVVRCTNDRQQLVSDAALLAAVQAALPAGTNQIGFVGLQANTTGGCTPTHYLSAASTNSTSVKASAGTVCSVTVIQNTATAADLRLYDTASAPTCSSGTGVVANFGIQANTASPGLSPNLGPFGLNFTTGIGFCLTAYDGTDTNNSNATTGLQIVLGTK